MIFPTSKHGILDPRSQPCVVAHPEQELKPRNWAPELTGFFILVQVVDLALNALFCWVGSSLSTHPQPLYSRHGPQSLYSPYSLPSPPIFTIRQLYSGVARQVFRQLGSQVTASHWSVLRKRMSWLVSTWAGGMMGVEKCPKSSLSFGVSSELRSQNSEYGLGRLSTNAALAWVESCSCLEPRGCQIHYK
jgi:hypothetical protein